MRYWTNVIPLTASDIAPLLSLVAHIIWVKVVNMLNVKNNYYMFCYILLQTFSFRKKCLKLSCMKNIFSNVLL